jgi:hypothetical protein
VSVEIRTVKCVEYLQNAITDRFWSGHGKDNRPTKTSRSFLRPYHGKAEVILSARPLKA